MYNQMNQDSQKKSKKDEVPRNPEAALVKSFLKDTTDFAKTEKRIISSNS
jgi:hypothetical protein